MILIIQNGSYFGGAERALVNFLEDLNNKSSCIVYSSSDRDYLDRIKRIGVKVVIPSRNILRFGDFFYNRLKGGWIVKEVISLIYFMMYVFVSRPKLVHLNNSFKYMNVYCAAISFLGIKYSIHIRGLINQVAISKKVLENSMYSICVSGCVADEYKKIYPHLSSKFYVIYDRVKIDSFESSKKNTFTFLAPAVIEPRKGQDLAILSFSKFLKSCPNKNVMLKIAGSSHPAFLDFYESLKKLVISLEIEKNVSFLNHCENMSDVYRDANVVLMLSKDGEALGLVGIEAQLSSCILIAPCKGAIKEYLFNNVTGLIISELSVNEVSNKMLYSYTYWRELEEMRLNARSFALDNFSAENTSKKLFNILNKF